MVEKGLEAIGRVREINIFAVPTYILSLPLVYLVLWLGWSPAMAYWAVNIPPLLSFIINLILLSRFVGFPGLRYFNTIFLKNLLLIGASAIIPWLVQSQMPEGFLRFIVVCTLSVVCTVANLWLFGMNQATKQMVREKVLSKIHK